MNEIKSKKLVEIENTSRELRLLLHARAEEINKEHYNEGWNDAIEALVNELINPRNYERFDFDECLSDSDKANSFFKYVFEISKQVEGRNNV